MPETDRAEANEDVLDAIEDLEDGLSNLKEAIAEHPDTAVRASLSAEAGRIQEIMPRCRPI